MLFFVGLMAIPELGIAQETMPQTENLSMRKIRGYAQNALRTGDTYTALIYYKEWSKRKPENASVVLQLAELYRGARDYQHASDAYWKYLKLTGGQKNPMALYYAG